MRYYIYCDESTKKGEFYSNFYGGVLVNSKDFGIINAVLESKRIETVKTSELKWQKISSQNYSSYIEAIDTFFDFVQAKKIKVRIMFSGNRHKATGLTNEQRDNTFLLLYYQFLKHIFGLKHMPHDGDRNFLEVFFDHIPESSEKRKKFKNHVWDLQILSDFQNANVQINMNDIMEVDSSKHVLMQCLDVVLGAMNYKLNKMDMVKAEGSQRRGKKTLAKAKVCKFIIKRISHIYPYFSINQTTSLRGNVKNMWDDPYRHWHFMPKNGEFGE